MTATTAAAAAAAAARRRGVERLDAATVRRLFPEAQWRAWPPGYTPACGVAHFLRPAGVPFADVLDCVDEMRRDAQYPAHTDLATDYALWLRCHLAAHLRQLDERARRVLRRLTRRDRVVVHDAELRRLFALPPAAAPVATATSSSSNDHDGARACGAACSVAQCYTPYAVAQEYAMRPVAAARAPDDCVHFATLPQLYNVLYQCYESMSPLSGLMHSTGDDPPLTMELVQALALYLRRRVGELCACEDAFLRRRDDDYDCHDTSSSSHGDTTLTFARDTPVLSLFESGRLAAALNATELLLPHRVHAAQLPSQAAQRARHARMYEAWCRRDAGLAACLTTHDAHAASSSSSFAAAESMTVLQALHTYRPAIVLVSPHTDRDWLCDIRGFYSVREVVIMGRVDSPAMASFSCPFLSFGVLPGPHTYWLYNRHLRKASVATATATAAAAMSPPSRPTNTTTTTTSHHAAAPLIDAPHTSQGYTRCYHDLVSAHLICAHDSEELPQQYRCVLFQRTVPPTTTRATRPGNDAP